MSDLLPYLFGALTLAGLIYLVFSLFVGDTDLAIGDTDGGFTGLLVAAFLAVFGVIGLLGTLSGWNLIMTLVAAAAIGLLMGRLIMAILCFVMRQQTAPIVAEDLIGTSARVTIDTPAGKTGEAMVEEPHVSKFAIRETSGAELKRGDQVEVVDVNNGVLYVKRKRT